MTLLLACAVIPSPCEWRCHCLRLQTMSLPQLQPVYGKQCMSMVCPIFFSQYFSQTASQQLCTATLGNVLHPYLHRLHAHPCARGSPADALHLTDTQINGRTWYNVTKCCWLCCTTLGTLGSQQSSSVTSYYVWPFLCVHIQVSTFRWQGIHDTHCYGLEQCLLGQHMSRHSQAARGRSLTLMPKPRL